FFGVQRLQEMVCATGAASPDELCDLIFQHLDRFQAGAPQYDDMALLVVKLDGA
ncbi:MAG: SpoIIE family protein phosphatase, partial [Anaerolineales bacterium]